MKIDILLDNEKSYKVHIEELPELNFSSKVAIVTNPTIAGLHLGYLLAKLKAKNIFIIKKYKGVLIPFVPFLALGFGLTLILNNNFLTLPIF